MPRAIKINPDRFGELRRRQGLTQKAIAAKVNVDVGSVSRWERGTIGAVRQDVFHKLCEALRATENDLCGEGPLESKPPSESQKSQMNLNIDAACRNALHLVARRYGVTRQQIVEASPLLFLIAAEQSLRDRQKQLTDWSDLADHVVRATPSHLPTKLPVDDSALDYEQRSINARDLFGRVVVERTGGPRDPDWDYSENPFAVFLSNSLSGVAGSSQQVRWFPDLAPTYRICAEEAADIVGDDEEAAQAILSGFVALHDMPADVRKAPAAQRAQWVRAEANKLADEMVAQLDDLLGAPATDPQSDSPATIKDRTKQP